MIGENKTRIVQSMINSINNKEINLNHRLQRMPGQWNKDAEPVD